MREIFLSNYFEIGPMAWEEMSFKGFFLFLALAAILFSGVEPLGNFARGSSKEHSCEIISISIQWPRRRCRFKFFSNFSSGGHFV